MDPEHRSYCPGPYPWEELFAYLAGTEEADGAATEGDTERDATEIGDRLALSRQLDELREVAAEFQRRVVNLELELARLHGREQPPGGGGGSSIRL